MSQLKRIELGLALAITALALWLAVTRAMHAGGLWRDEAGAVSVALMPSVSDIPRVFQHEAFPLLFPLTVRTYASAAGISDAAFRGFGLLVSVGLLGALWLKARIVDRDVPLLGVVLLGLNALVVQWGATIRGYGLGIVAMVVTMSLIWRVATRPSVSVVAGALVAAVCSVQIVYANAASLLVIGLAGAAVALRNRAWRRALLILGIGGIAAVSLLPYRAAIEGAKEWSQIFQIPDFSFAFFAGRLADALSTNGSGIAWAWLAVLVGSVIVAVFAQFWRRVAEAGERRDAALYCAVILLLSVPAHFAFLKTLSYPTQRWYYLAVVGLVGVSLESGLLALPVNWARTAARLVLAAIFGAWSFVPAWQAAHLRQTNVDLIADKIEQSAEAGDVVVVMPWFFGVSFARYYQGPAWALTLPPLEDLSMHRYDLLKAQMAAPSPIQPVLDAMREALRAGGRVWVVGSVTDLPEGQLPPLLAPAPYDAFGWSESAYRDAWAQQAGYFLQRNVLSAELVPVATDVQIAPIEQPQLIVVKGWRGAVR